MLMRTWSTLTATGLPCLPTPLPRICSLKWTWTDIDSYCLTRLFDIVLMAARSRRGMTILSRILMELKDNFRQPRCGRSTSSGAMAPQLGLRDKIIANGKSNYWAKTQNYSFKVPKDYDDRVRIDRQNGDTLWQETYGWRPQ